MTRDAPTARPGGDRGSARANVDGLREAWEHRWLSHSGPPGRGEVAARRDLIEARAAIEALSQVEAPPFALDDEPWPVIGDVLGRVGRATSEVTVPVTAGRGRRVLLVERSAPGWRLDGVAPSVEWRAGVDRLAVFALDEGDNEVLALVPVGAPGVSVTEVPAVDRTRTFVSVAFERVVLTDGDVVTGLHERDVLEDRLTVLAMADAWRAADELLTRAAGRAGAEEVARERADLTACRAAVRAAARGAASPRLVERSLAVSLAAVHVFPTCRRVADVAAGLLPAGEGIDEVLRRKVAHHEDLADPAWHADRLLPFL